jgi:hypothetical protein
MPQVRHSNRSRIPWRSPVSALTANAAPPPLAIAGLDRVSEPAAQIAFDAQSIDHNFKRGPRLQRRAIDLVKPDCFAVESANAHSRDGGAFERLGDRIGQRQLDLRL